MSYICLFCDGLYDKAESDADTRAEFCSLICEDDYAAENDCDDDYDDESDEL